METILNCLQIWASKILQQFFVGWALPFNTSNTNFGFWVAPKGALSAQAGFWIQSLWLKAVSAMSNNTTDKKGTQTLVVGINIINQLT